MNITENLIGAIWPGLFLLFEEVNLASVLTAEFLNDHA
jgi:hypothetical protein